MQVTVRLRRKPGHDLRVPPGRQIGSNDIANKIAPAFTIPDRLDRAHRLPVLVPRPMWPVHTAPPTLAMIVFFIGRVKTITL
jgi:hypothetical protein